jgi:hypothetical protein
MELIKQEDFLTVVDHYVDLSEKHDLVELL